MTLGEPGVCQAAEGPLESHRPPSAAAGLGGFVGRGDVMTTRPGSRRWCAEPAWRAPSRTQEYYERRTREGKTRREIIRCLKRYAAREVFNLVRPVSTGLLS